MEKPYVKIIILLWVLFLVGAFITSAFVAIVSLYILGTLVGTTTLQLLTGAISAGSAVASASAAILIWRGNVQSRKTILIDRVLGPIYAEIRHSREILESWNADANGHALNTPFLQQVKSDWLYYTLDERLRAKVEDFQDLLPKLEQEKDIAKTQASNIIKDSAQTTFALQNIVTVIVWASHQWTEGQLNGEYGRQPIWELVVDSPSLMPPIGRFFHHLQITNTDNQVVKVLPLLSKDKMPLNAKIFQEFWELSRRQATSNYGITTLRVTHDQAIRLTSELEQKLGSEIKRLQ
jgi:hypothetical protein